MSKKQKPKAIIVGGSIAGISCAHALISAGWNVLVLEKSNSPPKGSSTGAGLRIDLLSQKIIKSWFSQPQRFQEITFPLAMDQNVVTDGDNTIRILTRDENFNFRTAHWADLHGLLYNDLPPEIFLWGYLCFSFCNSEGKTSVNVKAKCLQTDEIIELNGDLLVAADGGQSTIRRILLPDLKLRYSGYCAWRGVLDFSGKRSSDTVTGLKKVYPDLGNCSYFHLSSGSHSVLYELRKEELNWVWYVHHPEPELKGSSVTMKVSSDMINNMYQEAEKVWPPEFVKVMKETQEPFLNFIYDCDPLEQIVWENVVLIGDAAHPTTPHGARSTNMAIADAAVLGKCLGKWRVENLPSALEEYQHLRLPVTSKQVLHSRRMGRIKQGLSLPDRKPFDPKTATPEDCEELQDKNMPFFAGVPGLDGR
ncbi:6-hydroxynicotinate 3-monooxygenase isoform X1 [Ricinus communis]|uniref:Monoxygenase, putative n=1 Tax=Ricinus communis TaxID=3988 RepID=B9RK03_RICCO|nr:6-hydroxynicotinate 3-monooxygenase isoform X1 [Ricinus communis]EEF48311.1 monoxygenase, putative [Ricinus communis]